MGLEKEEQRPTKTVSLKEKLQQKMASLPDEPVKSSLSSITSKMTQRRTALRQEEKKFTLFLDNIPPSYNECDIEDELQEFKLNRINIVRRDAGAGKVSTGQAFIVLDSQVETDKCLEFLSQARWEYRVISAKISTSSY
jgi:RNA recognition motif-containing protein